jgi:PhoPQ-activated pathogenicity-related protein
MKHKVLGIALAAVLSCVPLLARQSVAPNSQTPLDTYVQAPDPHYHYELVQQTKHPGYTLYLLQMTSQKWRSAEDVDRTLWQHWITIYKPTRVVSTTGMLLITGYSNDGHRPDPAVDPMLASLATTSHTVVSAVFDVPNQPLTFANDAHGPRGEDEIIAYTWKKYLDTGDAMWLARLPMTKAAVRAMDTVESFMASEKGGKHEVRNFVVAGASKRGWTTWTTAAVDHRVVAIIPMVIDVLNVIPSFTHHYRSYGFWSPAVTDYFNLGLMDQLNKAAFRNLLSVVDPYSYRDRYTMPKLIINAAGDPFFVPDSSKFYFNDLPGEKYLRYMPNADHSLDGTDVEENITAFYLSIIENVKRPRFGWTLESNGDIRVTTTDQPIAVKLWQATNPEHRDFRVEWVGPLYHETPLPATEQGVYLAHVPEPAQGWTAFFVELVYPGSNEQYPLHFTTAVRILPDAEPFPSPVPGATRLGDNPKSEK